jgi:predicted phage terminase large subunit-like protein
LPAVYEAQHPFPIRTSVLRKATREIWTDPRKEGEALWPEKYPLEALQRMAKDESMSSHMAAGQLQQRPTAREGGLFKREWFNNPVKLVPYDRLNLVRAWDLASASDPSSDPDTKILYVLDVIRGRFSPGQREQKIISTAMLDGTSCAIRIPQDPGGAGKFEAHHLAGLLQGYSVATEREEGSKENRADPFAAQCEHGFVKMVEGPWNRAFVEELCAFPNGAHDDQVDAASAAFRAVIRQRKFSVVGVRF